MWDQQKSPAFTEFTARSMACYLGKLSRQFIARELSDEYIENVDKTDVLYKMDTQGMLDIRNDPDINYRNVQLSVWC